MDEGIQTVGQDTSRIFGRPFVTAGWIVLQVSVVVAAVEIGMLVIIMRREASVRLHMSKKMWADCLEFIF